MNIIDIHERINAKNGPDAEHVRIGADGDGRHGAIRCAAVDRRQSDRSQAACDLLGSVEIA